MIQSQPEKNFRLSASIEAIDSAVHSGDLRTLTQHVTPILFATGPDATKNREKIYEFLVEAKKVAIKFGHSIVAKYLDAVIQSHHNLLKKTYLQDFSWEKFGSTIRSAAQVGDSEKLWKEIELLYLYHTENPAEVKHKLLFHLQETLVFLSVTQDWSSTRHIASVIKLEVEKSGSLDDLRKHVLPLIFDHKKFGIAIKEAVKNDDIDALWERIELLNEIRAITPGGVMAEINQSIVETLEIAELHSRFDLRPLLSQWKQWADTADLAGQQNAFSLLRTFKREQVCNRIKMQEVRADAADLVRWRADFSLLRERIKRQEQRVETKQAHSARGLSPGGVGALDVAGMYIDSNPILALNIPLVQKTMQKEKKLHGESQKSSFFSKAKAYPAEARPGTVSTSLLAILFVASRLISEPVASSSITTSSVVGEAEPVTTNATSSLYVLGGTTFVMASLSQVQPQPVAPQNLEQRVDNPSTQEEDARSGDEDVSDTMHNPARPSPE